MRSNSVKTLTQCALLAALSAICAWISIPGPGGISFTLQSFAIALTLGLLGGKNGAITIGVYLLLGLVGAPVFSGFRGGLGALLDASGGYLLGFPVFALVYWLISALPLPKKAAQPVALAAGMVCCYLFGAAWYTLVYLPTGSSFLFALGVYVLPYVLPDALKLALAYYLSRKLRQFV